MKAWLTELVEQVASSEGPLTVERDAAQEAWDALTEDGRKDLMGLLIEEIELKQSRENVIRHLFMMEPVEPARRAGTNETWDASAHTQGCFAI